MEVSVAAEMMEASAGGGDDGSEGNNGRGGRGPSR